MIKSFLYQDIINLKRPKSNHEKMSIINRAAQFAPFAALSGHDEAIMESGILKFERIEISEDKRFLIDIKLKDLLKNRSKKSIITYYQEDFSTYTSVEDGIDSYDVYNEEIKLRGGTIIRLDDIYDID